MPRRCGGHLRSLEPSCRHRICGPVRGWCWPGWWRTARRSLSAFITLIEGMKGSLKNCVEWARILSGSMERLADRSVPPQLKRSDCSGEQPSYEPLLDRRKFLSSRDLAETERL